MGVTLSPPVLSPQGMSCTMRMLCSSPALAKAAASPRRRFRSGGPRRSSPRWVPTAPRSTCCWGSKPSQVGAAGLRTRETNIMGRELNGGVFPNCEADAVPVLSQELCRCRATRTLPRQSLLSLHCPRARSCSSTPTPAPRRPWMTQVRGWRREWGDVFGGCC